MRRFAIPLLKSLLSIVLVFALLVAAMAVWYYNRPHPPGERRRLFEGVEYVRESVMEPRPLVIHAITVDLNAQGIGFKVTPGDAGAELPIVSRKTTQFLEEFGLQIAVNGDFAEPFHSSSPWDYSPRVGDRVRVLGRAVSDGVLYEEGREWEQRPALFVSKEGDLSFTEPSEIWQAISGDVFFVKDGKPFDNPKFYEYHTTLHPRLAICLNRDRSKLILIVVDGRQPNFSEGVTLQEMAAIVIRFGADQALNMDGGGSATIAVEGKNGRPEILNCPIDNYIPDRERPVGNHLGIFAEKL